jgi:Leucine-rich repeat (LRR) protein
MLLTVEQQPPAPANNDQREKERILADLAALEAAETSELCLNYRRLKSVPDTLVESTYCQISLMKLYLKGNLINQMPSQLWLLRNLKELYLHSNSLQELPPELSKLSSLESLNVACNQLTTLPSAIGKLAKLKCLNVTQNRISHIPDELWEAPHLEQLLASSNELTFLSPSILQCQSLHTLVLDNNRLTELPVQVTRLLNLKRLSVCGNNLTALPSDFSALSNLEVVYVDGNSRLYSIPAALTGIKSVGVQGCNVSFRGHVTAGGKSVGCAIRVLAPHASVPPLMEQAALAVHNSLKSKHSYFIIEGSDYSMWV